MAWTVLALNHLVEEEIEKLPVDMRAIRSGTLKTSFGSCASQEEAEFHGRSM
jgi:hypothetical protein